MKILITGHKGFIGSHLTKRLDDLNIDWVGLDLPDDIRNDFSIDDDITHVIHLAALTGVRDGERIQKEFLTTNIIGTFNLIQKSLDKKFIFFSSSSVYGNQKPPHNEYTPHNPDGIYAITKETGEMLVKHLHPNYLIIRPFTVYGENGRENQLIYKWKNLIKDGKQITFYGDGETKRGYTYVVDLIDGLLLLINENGEYNLGGREVYSLNDVLEIFKEKYNVKVDYKELPKGDVYENYADITKAEQKGYNPTTDFKTKLKQII